MPQDYMGAQNGIGRRRCLVLRVFSAALRLCVKLSRGKLISRKDAKAPRLAKPNQDTTRKYIQLVLNVANSYNS